jgi:hypothetical protein
MQPVKIKGVIIAEKIHLDAFMLLTSIVRVPWSRGNLEGKTWQPEAVRCAKRVMATTKPAESGIQKGLFARQLRTSTQSFDDGS